MPPKSAMNSKRNNKNKKCNEPHVTLKTTTDVNSTSGLNPEAEDQFELELCWCIQQLEATLVSGKLHGKQAEDLNKHLRSLKSNTAPLIKKRQIMRNTLGDYKDKMVKDEQKLNKIVSSIKFTNPAAVNKKSMFIKKAIRHSKQNHEEQTDDNRVQEILVGSKQIINNRTQIPFQFNFQTCE